MFREFEIDSRSLRLDAEASIPEEPGAGKPHAGICAGAIRVTDSSTAMTALKATRRQT